MTTARASVLKRWRPQQAQPVVAFEEDVARAAEVASVLLANLDQLSEALTKGAMVAVTESAVRVRALPVR